MKHRILWLAFLLLLLPILACQNDTPFSPPTGQQDVARRDADAEQIALAIMDRTGWPAEDEEGNPILLDGIRDISLDKCEILSADKQMITGDIAHYNFVVRVGPGPYDHIGLHRVVKEGAHDRPIKTKKSVFLQHGASTDFTFCYLPGLYSENLPDDFGMSVYLAEHGIDVWGIDQRWCLVPPEETDFSFMATWGLPMHIDDLGLGVNVARQMRRMTGNGWDQMLLLGFSFGAEISFGLVDGETQLPPGRRSIKGFIPVDMVIKVPEESPWRDWLCNVQPYYEGQLAAGIYGEGAFFRPAGLLARDDPDGDSPFFPGSTNYQAALAIGTTLLYGVPPFHLFSGLFDGELPVGMQFIDNDTWIELLCTMSYVESNVASLDQCYEICGGNVPWGSHWGQIRVPIFFLTPRGGFGEAGLYQLGLLGSDDVSSLVVSAVPGDETLDFGHLDLFLTTRAESLVWQPIMAWIVDHSHPGHH